MLMTATQGVLQRLPILKRGRNIQVFVWPTMWAKSAEKSSDRRFVFAHLIMKAFPSVDDRLVFIRGICLHHMLSVYSPADSRLTYTLYCRSMKKIIIIAEVSVYIACISSVKCIYSIPLHDFVTQLAGKQQVIVIKQVNCNQMTARCIQGVTLGKSTLSIMSILVLIKSLSHCVKSERVIQAMSQWWSPRGHVVSLERPHDLDGAGISANEGELACMCVCVELARVNTGWN